MPRHPPLRRLGGDAAARSRSCASRMPRNTTTAPTGSFQQSSSPSTSDAEGDADDRRDVGHRGGARRAPGAEGVLVPDVSHTRAQAPEQHDAADDPGIQGDRCQCDERRQHEHDGGGDADVQEREHQSAHTGVGDELAHVREAESIARGRAEDRELRDEALAQIQSLPRRDDDHDAQDADEDARDLHQFEPLDAEQQPRHDRRHDRRRRVVDARQPRRDVLLCPGEEQEGHDAERERQHGHVAPELETPRKRVAAQRDEQPEGEPAEEEPRPHDLTGRDAVERDLHEQEARPPDDSGEDELNDDPSLRQRAAAGCRARGLGGRGGGG